MDKYELVPLFGNEEKIPDCITLLNEEWPKSETFRLNSLNKYCKPSPPMSVILLDSETRELIGHSRFLNVCNYGAGRAAYLESLIIRKADRGKGIGKVLVQKCVEKAKNEGYSVVLLCTEDQMEFYEKCGFQCCEFLPILTMGVEACVASSVVFSEIKPIDRKECKTTLPVSNGVLPSSAALTAISNGPLPPPPPAPSIKSPVRVNKPEQFMFLYL
ncbi:unnamed protein product [Bursaphelenchus xylophilus]|uniref:(pine wood nematode) hypothetical protein n=1 Tax=Bursaphelenchus xylophilus TaxID=6326 RepID=A0A1I7RZE0_BURXY|nr:unnamed protein product [Bursaphelenchus xylophilus]CAG9106536.1 unnamed protein product [Bursaphelenchus xylophilus]